MAEQFAKAFKEIGVHFQDIFSRLFGGGTAHLALTDKEHILEAAWKSISARLERSSSP